MNRSKRIERTNHLKVVIPETYSIDQCADLPFPGALYTHGLSLHHDQLWKGFFYIPGIVKLRESGRAGGLPRINYNVSSQRYPIQKIRKIRYQLELLEWLRRSDGAT